MLDSVSNALLLNPPIFYVDNGYHFHYIILPKLKTMVGKLNHEEKFYKKD